MKHGKRPGRISLGRAQGHGCWELRVSEGRASGQVVTVRLTPYELSDLLAGAWTNVEIETPSPTETGGGDGR